MRAAAVASGSRLPGLAMALDPAGLGERLESQLRAHDPSFRIQDVRLIDVQVEEERAAILARVSATRDGQSRTGRQSVFIRLAPSAEELPRATERQLRRYAERRRSVPSAEAPIPHGAIEIPELALAAFAYPLDPHLESLVDVTDPGFLCREINELWRRRGVKVRQVRVRTLSYTPEARAALRYEVLSESRDDRVPEIRHLVGKLQTRRSPAELFSGHWAIWRSTFGRVRVAPPVGYLAVPGLSLQEVVSGARLSDLADRGDFVKSVRQAARSIAVVHSLDLPLAAVRGVEKEAHTVQRWIAVLRRIRPALDARLGRLEARLLAELESSHRELAPVHSDFHLANVLADDEGVVLIDWDQVAIGDPASDVGRFLGALRVSALRTAGRADALDEVGDAFVEAYLDTRSEDRSRIRLFEACGLVIAAASPFRLQRDGWEESAETMIDLAERCLEEATRVSSRSVPSGPAEFDAEDRAAWGLDPVFAQALLVPPLRLAVGSDLEVYRSRSERLSPPGGRLRLRWLLNGHRGEARWKGVVEGIALSPRARAGLVRRLGALRAATRETPGAMLLPEPLAFLPGLGLAALLASWPRPLPPLALPTDGGLIEHRIGHALGVLQTTSVALSRTRSVAQELRATARRLARVDPEQDGILSALARRLVRIARRLASAPTSMAPQLRGLHLRELGLHDGAIGVAAVRDVVLGPRPIAVAELLAELAALADDPAEPAGSSGALRSGWLSATGAPASELAPWEALAALRRAADEAAADARGPARTERWLERIDRTLES